MEQLLICLSTALIAGLLMSRLAKAVHLPAVTSYLLPGHGCSYAFRVEDIVRIYDEHSRSGLSNREILRRYIWPKYHICEKTFYNIINASADPKVIRRQEEMRSQLSLF